MELTEFYKKYPHVVKNSVRKATAADKRKLEFIHKNVCVIECVDCGKRRLINTSDAFQVKRCDKCRKAEKAERRRELRAARKSA